MKRKSFFVADQASLLAVDVQLDNGWLFDPLFKGPVRLDHAVIYPLIKYSTEELAAMMEEDQRRPGEFEDVVDMAKVDFEQVKGKVAEGFIVHQIYSTGAVMLKRKEVTA